MSGVERVDPSGIPEFTGNLEQLEQDASALKGDARTIRSTGSRIHTDFQGLKAFYDAPEADQLFATTKPVSDRADDFADDLEKVGTALDGFATEARPIVAKLRRLKGEATAFVNSIKDDDDWQYDGDKTDRNNDLLQDISTAVAEFWAAERAAANKITRLVGGTQWAADDGTGAENMYGFSVDDMRQAGETPWGKAVEEKRHWYEVHHHLKSFVWDGFIVDGVWGTLVGLGGLVGLQGWDTFKESWKGLGQLATGLAVLSTPGALLATQFLPDGAVKDWVDESMNTTKEVGKSLVAWDEWGKDPARAAGLVVFNVVTTIGTGGAGLVAKTGTAGKIANAAGKVGHIADPMTYIGKGVSATLGALPKIGDVTAGLKGLTTIKAIELPDGRLALPDGQVIPQTGPLPELPPGRTAVEIPDGSVKLPDGNLLTPDGSLLDPGGRPVQSGDNAMVEPSAGDRAVLDGGNPAGNPAGAADNAANPAGGPANPAGNVVDNAAVREPELVSVGGGDRAPGSAAGDLTPGGPVPGLGDNLPGGPREVPGTTPGSTAPGSTVPGSTVPGSTVPGGTGPGGFGPDGPTAGYRQDGTGGGPNGPTGPTGDGLPGGAARETPGGGPAGGAADNAGRGGTGGPPGGPVAGGFDGPPSGALPDGPTGGQGLSDGPPGAGALPDDPGAVPAAGRTADDASPLPTDRTGMTPEEVVRHQLDLANAPDGKWFEQYYNKVGHRRSVETPDAFGDLLPQLRWDVNAPGGPRWIAASDMPPASPPRYLDGNGVLGDRASVRPEHVQTLEDAAARRQEAIDADQLAEKDLAKTREAHKADPTPENQAAVERAEADHSPKHRDSNLNSEKLGDLAAEYHAMPDHYPDFTRVDNKATGNNRFDQIWKGPDGRYVVVEAKGSTKAQLGDRNGLNGRRVMQGTREYFETILQEMRTRTRIDAEEVALARELRIALDSGKVDYVLVKADPNGSRYGGYQMKQFKID
ncbi:hypothetical protein QNO07_05905 [Streptomyces sp. 549]|uniref:hypothetical protein n=1 Tax=Streptomyces sp. 549 TaxID=3049076 RepID=UPI0024C461A3|nr:hypothetical protein [Streptomyces sp. 549]MDK1472967.1 hypothetical protein [Streptomyces sp. 549]